MKTLVHFMVLVAVALPALADETSVPFDRYQIIIDRKPFGALPPPVAEQKAPSAPVDSFTKYYRVCSIVKEDDGSLTVGVVDSRGNKAIVLKKDQADPSGLLLIDANYEAENATLRMGEEIAVMDLRGSVAPAGGAAPAAPQVAMAPAGMPTPPAAPPSYADRRRIRQLQTQEPAQPPPQPKYTGEALQKHLQDYQMEVIRQGLPPLPIPLSPDQDAQLVKEGVLPPQ